MNLKKLLYSLFLIIATVSLTIAQGIQAYNAGEKSLFSSKGKEFLATRVDTLMLISYLPNRKELWLYRPSMDSIEKHKAEIFYKPHLFNFAGHSLAFYDVIMNRFTFSTLQDGKLSDYMGDKLKGMGEESIGLSLPRFYFFNNHWLVLSLAGYAYMDNKLLYGYLTEEGKWVIPPTSLFEYPEGLKQHFGLVRAYTTTAFNGMQLLCTEVSGSHPIAIANNRPNGLLLLTEVNRYFSVNRHIPLISQEDSVSLSKDTPNVIELLPIGDRIALTIKSENAIYAKMLSPDYRQLKHVTIAEGATILKSSGIPIGNGFILTYSTPEHILAAYVTRDGDIRKHWKIHTAAMGYVDFYCLKDEENFYLIINDKQVSEVIQKAIPISDLEK